MNTGISSNIDIYSTSVEYRKKLFNRARLLASVEHGAFPEESESYYYDWISGERQLYEVRAAEFSRYSSFAEGKPILNNKLGISSPRIFDMACSSLVTSRLIELLAMEDVLLPKMQNMTVPFFNKLHQTMYFDIFPWCGKIRKREIKVAEALIEKQEIFYMKHGLIESRLDFILKVLNNRQYAKRPVYERDESEESRITKRISYRNDVIRDCIFLTQELSEMMYCRPYYVGNLNVLIFYLIMYGKIKELPITLKGIKGYMDDKYLQRCFLLSTFIMYQMKTEQRKEETVPEEMRFLANLLYCMGWEDLHDSENEDAKFADKEENKNRIKMLSGKLFDGDDE